MSIKNSLLSKFILPLISKKNSRASDTVSLSTFLDGCIINNLTSEDISISSHLFIGVGSRKCASLIFDKDVVEVINLPKYERYPIVYIVTEEVAGFAGVWLKRDDVAYVKQIDGNIYLIFPATGKIFPNLPESVYKEGRCVRHLKTWGEYRIFLAPNRFILERSGERLYGYRHRQDPLGTIWGRTQENFEEEDRFVPLD